MSDGITDAYRAEREDRDHANALMALATHLVVRTQDTYEKLLSLHNGPFVKMIEIRVQKLIEGDLPTWARFLLDCQENYETAFNRARKLSPWPVDYKIDKIEFSTFNDVGKFWKPFFEAQGYATLGPHGNGSGYDSYAIFYTEDMSLKQIVKTSVWLGWRRISWTSNKPDTLAPTTPIKKDRKV